MVSTCGVCGLGRHTCGLGRHTCCPPRISACAGGGRSTCGFCFAKLRATAILCLENYEGGAPEPNEGELDGGVAAKLYVKDVWVHGILSFLEPGEYSKVLHM
jgi:hypothetical protein